MDTYHPNLQPFQQQPQASTYYAGQGTQAFMELKRRCETMWLGWLAYRAGKNFYLIHPNVEDAFIHGAHALRRWWVWLFFVKVWLFSAAFLGWMMYLRFHDIRGESYNVNRDFNIVTTKILIFIVPAFFALLITYCRNIDFSLFKRNFVYKLLKPVTMLTNVIPNWMLYLIVPCMLCFPFPMMD